MKTRPKASPKRCKKPSRAAATRPVASLATRAAVAQPKAKDLPKPLPTTVAAPRADIRPPLTRRAARWEQVTARDLMRKDVATVADSAPLSEVERVLSENRVSGVPVVNEAGAIIGIVSVRDLIDRYAEDAAAHPRRGPSWFHLSSDESLDEDLESFEVPEEAEETAADVMTAEVYSVPADAGLADIARTMTTHKIHRVLVEHGGAYIGLIGTLEILDALSA